MLIPFIRALAAVVLIAGGLSGAEAADKVMRIGYQKDGTLILLKAAGTPLIGALERLDSGTAGHVEEAAAQLSAAIHVPAPVVATALGRQSFGITGIAPQTAADQQKIDDAFGRLGLLPKPVTVADALVSPAL